MSKLILASMLTAGVFSLSGCIENLEPAGISDLRGAKAELLRAQTALQAAEAAKVQAEAQLMLAEAKVQEAIAKQEEARVAFVEAQAKKMEYEAEAVKLENEFLTLTNDAERIKNEAARAELEQQIKLYELQMQAAENEAAEAAARLEVTLLEIQESLAKAQANYETALKEIELAKATLTPEEKTQLAALEKAVSDARNDVETKTAAYIDAGKALATATANADPEKGRENALRQAKKDLANAKAGFDAAVEAEKLAEEMMKLDATLEGWIAKQDELEAKKAELDKKLTETKAANDVRRVDLTKELEAITKKAIDYQNRTGYKYDNKTGLFSILPNSAYKSESFDLPEVYIAAPKNAEGESVASDFQYSGRTYRFGEEKAVLDEIDATLENLKSIAEGTAYRNSIEYYENRMIEIKESVDYKILAAKYEDVVAAYNSGDIDAYFVKYENLNPEFDIDKATEEYNAAYTAFFAAIDEYEAAVKANSADFSEQYSNILNTRNKAIAAAQEKRALARQKAENDFLVAKKAYAKANTAYSNAQAAYNDAIELNTAEASEYDMRQYLEIEYPTIPDPTDEETAKKGRFETYLKNIEKANTVWTAANTAWATADAAFSKAQSDYSAALNKADNDCDKEEQEARRVYSYAFAQIQASEPTFDSKYQTVLTNKMDDAQSDLQNAINVISNNIEGRYVMPSYSQSMEYVAASESSYSYYMSIDVPEYLAPEVYDPLTNTVTKTLRQVVPNDIKDMDYFVSEYVASVAEQMMYCKLYVYVWGIDYNDNWQNANDEVTVDFSGCENYPLELPAYEDYMNAVNDAFENKKSELFDNYGIISDRNGGYSWSASRYSYVNYMAPSRIESYEKDLANVALLPDFIRAIEETRAEFVALFEANEKEMEALKAEVEAAAPALIAEQEELDLAEDTLDAEVGVMTKKIKVYVDLIETYCGKNSNWEATDKETFEKYLKEEYDAAVKATFEAETAYLDEQKTYADVEAGLLDAVATAERKLKIAEEELKEANDRLARATAELQAALGILYGTPSVE